MAYQEAVGASEVAVTFQFVAIFENATEVHFLRFLGRPK